VQSAPLTLAEVTYPRPTDVAATGAFGGGLPQRSWLELSVASAAEALDHERLHAPIFAAAGGYGRPPAG
jgi:hypothetical protein